MRKEANMHNTKHFMPDLSAVKKDFKKKKKQQSNLLDGYDSTISLLASYFHSVSARNLGLMFDCAFNFDKLIKSEK